MLVIRDTHTGYLQYRRRSDRERTCSRVQGDAVHLCTGRDREAGLVAGCKGRRVGWTIRNS